MMTSANWQGTVCARAPELSLRVFVIGGSAPATFGPVLFTFRNAAEVRLWLTAVTQLTRD